MRDISLHGTAPLAQGHPSALGSALVFVNARLPAEEPGRRSLMHEAKEIQDVQEVCTLQKPVSVYYINPSVI